MVFKEVENKLLVALSMLKSNDEFLFEHNVSERSIAHKFAQYLSILFKGYDVDCEYNSNVEADSGKKYIGLLKDIAAHYGLLREGEKDAEIVYRNVFPDIIVHKRGLNSDNLLIVEMKKSSSNISCDYDIEKLNRYTSPEYENTLNYAFGVLVYLGVADKSGDDCIVWFQNGNNIDRSG